MTRKGLLSTFLLFAAASSLSLGRGSGYSLSRVRGLFRAADGDRSGRVEWGEARRLGFSRYQFRAFDFDADGGLAGEEFTVGFRQWAASTRRRVEPDLAAHVAQVLARRRARAAELRCGERRKAERPAGSPRPSPAGPADARLDVGPTRRGRGGHGAGEATDERARAAAERCGRSGAAADEASGEPSPQRGPESVEKDGAQEGGGKASTPAGGTGGGAARVRANR